MRKERLTVNLRRAGDVMGHALLPIYLAKIQKPEQSQWWCRCVQKGTGNGVQVREKRTWEPSTLFAHFSINLNLFKTIKSIIFFKNSKTK